MKQKKKIVLLFLLIAFLGGVFGYTIHQQFYVLSKSDAKKIITWVDFKVTAECMRKAAEIDIQTFGSKKHCDWIALLAYAGTRTGGEFGKKAEKYITEAAEQLTNNEKSVGKWKKELKYYSYYYEAYEAVLRGFLGKYTVIEKNEKGEENKIEKYGLRAYLPIAKGFPYSHYDDFGSSRSYGFRRQHLGHDMMGQIGTPIIAVESGYVEALGWNQYGGWRIGIRSFDQKRYYYYAHLRQNRPYAEGLKEGDYVTAGDVIGYMGHTGYSKTENVNNIEVTHLHFGMQLIFDESQKECNSEIWINCYEIVRFLQANQSEVIRNDETKEWKRAQNIVIEIPKVSPET